MVRPQRRGRAMESTLASRSATRERPPAEHKLPPLHGLRGDPSGTGRLSLRTPRRCRRPCGSRNTSRVPGRSLLRAIQRVIVVTVSGTRSGGSLSPRLSVMRVPLVIYQVSAASRHVYLQPGRHPQSERGPRSVTAKSEEIDLGVPSSIRGRREWSGATISFPMGHQLSRPG